MRPWRFLAERWWGEGYKIMKLVINRKLKIFLLALMSVSVSFLLVLLVDMLLNVLFLDGYEVRDSYILNCSTRRGVQECNFGSYFEDFFTHLHFLLWSPLIFLLSVKMLRFLDKKP